MHDLETIKWRNSPEYLAKRGLERKNDAFRKVDTSKLDRERIVRNERLAERNRRNNPWSEPPAS